MPPRCWRRRDVAVCRNNMAAYRRGQPQSAHPSRRPAHRRGQVEPTYPPGPSARPAPSARACFALSAHLRPLRPRTELSARSHEAVCGSDGPVATLITSALAPDSSAGKQPTDGARAGGRALHRPTRRRCTRQPGAHKSLESTLCRVANGRPYIRGSIESLIMG